MRSLIVIVLVGIAVWVGYYQYTAVRTLGEPEYQVFESVDRYEIRGYESYAVAFIDVSGSTEAALKDGYLFLEDYFNGNNLTQQVIPLKLPVVEVVLADGRRRILATFPREVSATRAPRPNRTEVQVVTIPARTVAVLRFSWWASAARIDEQKRELLEILKLADIEVAGAPETAFYSLSLNSPYEIMVPIVVR